MNHIRYYFYKLHCLGNDYIYLDCFEQNVPPGIFEKMARMLSKRRFGIGSDGLILIMPSDTADCKMRIFNADGSEGKMCGNGIRCVAWYMRHIKNIDKSIFRIETLSGERTVTVNGDHVTACMGTPDFNLFNPPAIEKCIFAGRKFISVTCLSMGNPHCVIFVKKFPKDIEKFSKAVNGHSMFKEEVNIEYVKIISHDHFKVRVYERGSGNTAACGSGACASVCAAMVTGRIRGMTGVNVELDGGSLKVELKENIRVFLSGVVNCVYRGEFEFQFESEPQICHDREPNLKFGSRVRALNCSDMEG